MFDGRRVRAQTAPPLKSGRIAALGSFVPLPPPIMSAVIIPRPALPLQDRMGSTKLRKLIEKYAGFGPRYTSYPTAVEFNGDVGEAAWRNRIARSFSEKSGPFACYVHIPFCRSLCYFCACHKLIVTDRTVVAPYLDAVAREAAEYGELGRNSVVTQLHWGGGSPSYLTVEETARLFRALSDSLPLDLRGGDISLELDPRTTDREKIALYRSLGFNRLSLGVQDFHPAVQEAVNRRQSREETVDLVAYARKEGFSSVNVDLIYGLPEQTPERFSETIDAVLSLRPDRIALYGYAHVTWLKKVQKALERHHLPTPGERVELFLSALDSLRLAGYVYIGMDHFALPADPLALAYSNGSLQRSFMGYTTRRANRLAALGASAISSVPEMIAQNTRDVAEYTRRAAAGEIPIERGVVRSEDDQLRASLIESLFCAGKIDIPAVEARWSISFWKKFDSLERSLRELEADGLAEVSPWAIRITETGRLFTRNVAMLFDGYLEARLAAQSRAFSATV